MSEASDPALLYDGNAEVADGLLDEEAGDAESLLQEGLGRVTAFARCFPSGRPSIVPTSQYSKRPVGVSPLRGKVGGRAILKRRLETSVGSKA